VSEPHSDSQLAADDDAFDELSAQISALPSDDLDAADASEDAEPTIDADEDGDDEAIEEDTMPTILIIEDDVRTVRVLYRTLKNAGYRLLGAQRAVDGLDVARKQRPDLILTRIDLPDMTGRELAVALRSDKRFLHTPIIGISDTGLPEERELSFAVGFTGFVDKPINTDALPLQIEFFLSGGHDGMDKTDVQRIESARMKYLRDVVSRLEKRIRELEAQNEELAQFDRMKDNFIQLTAHELRTPLTLMTGYSKLLEDYTPLQVLMGYDDNGRMLMNGLLEAIDRMQIIIEEVLTISRIMTRKFDLNLRSTQLGQLVKGVLNSYEAALQERALALHFDVNQWNYSIHADPDLLRLVVLNLISNAIKYTPNKGRITLDCQVEDELVRFSVQDNGIGIDKRQHEAIFKRMQVSPDVDLHTTSKTAFGGGGLGLGLAICKGIVEAHGGRIWVESKGMDRELLPGSTFFVELPLKARVPPGAQARKTQTMKRAE